VELLEYAPLLFVGYPRTGVSDADSKVPVGLGRNNSHLTGIGKLDGITDQIEQHLCQALLIAKAYG